MPLPGGRHEQEQFLLHCAMGNQDAARLLSDFALAARYADNIVDKSDISLVPALLFKCLVDIPSNPFFRANYQTLAAPITEAIAAWQISDEFRKSDDKKKQAFGYVWRESTDRLAVAVALITGGADFAASVLRAVYDVCHAPNKETLEEWIR
jgi:hypothetical protein